MSRRERLFAAWLQLRSGWDHIDLRTAAAYDMESDRVVIEWEPGGTVWFAVCRWDADRTLMEIEERFGADARRRAEMAIEKP